MYDDENENVTPDSETKETTSEITPETTPETTPEVAPEVAPEVTLEKPVDEEPAVVEKPLRNPLDNIDVGLDDINVF